jgi:hypothetical protein
MEDTNKIQMTMDTDPQIARLIIETAEYLAKMPPAGYVHNAENPTFQFRRPDAALVNEAADLVFLALSLISEKRS